MPYSQFSCFRWKEFPLKRVSVEMSFRWKEFPLKRVSVERYTKKPGFKGKHEGLGCVKICPYFGMQGFYISTSFTNMLVVCFTVASLSLSLSLSFSHGRSLTHGSYVVLATDRNQLSLGASAEDTLNTTGDAVAAASVQTCAMEAMWAPAVPMSQLIASEIHILLAKESDIKTKMGVSNNHFREISVPYIGIWSSGRGY
jgi:hypothetical protein